MSQPAAKHVKDLSIIPKRSDHNVQFFYFLCLFYILSMNLLNAGIKCQSTIIKEKELFGFETIVLC